MYSKRQRGVHNKINIGGLLMRKITNYNSFCRDYLGVSESEVPSFIVRNKNTIDRLIARYGIPLSERMSAAKTKIGVPLMYGTDDYEIMLKCDFGKYGGTEEAKVVESVGDFVVYTFRANNKPKAATPSVRTTSFNAPSQSMLPGIEFRTYVEPSKPKAKTSVVEFDPFDACLEI